MPDSGRTPCSRAGPSAYNGYSRSGTYSIIGQCGLSGYGPCRGHVTVRCLLLPSMACVHSSWVTSPYGTEPMKPPLITISGLSCRSFSRLSAKDSLPPPNCGITKVVHLPSHLKMVSLLKRYDFPWGDW